MIRIGIIGSGLTGVLTAFLIKSRISGTKITILEKSRGTGGRFSTSRSPFETSIDLGAQFITKTSNLNPYYLSYYNELSNAGILQPLAGVVEGLKSKHFENLISPSGIGAVVKHFTPYADHLLFNKRVVKIEQVEDKWSLICENEDDAFKFDVVISTIPVPQVLLLNGISSYISEDDLENLKGVQYSSRYALGLFYNYDTNYFNNLPWVAKYVSENDVVAFCSVDNRKRDVNYNPSLVIHTTKEFGKEHLDGDSAHIQKVILDEISNLLPQIPEPSFIKFHKWKYSQVEVHYPGKPGCMVGSKHPTFIIGGDGFSKSTFEGCIDSSESIVQALQPLLNELDNSG